MYGVRSLHLLRTAYSPSEKRQPSQAEPLIRLRWDLHVVSQSTGPRNLHTTLLPFFIILVQPYVGRRFSALHGLVDGDVIPKAVIFWGENR